MSRASLRPFDEAEGVRPQIIAYAHPFELLGVIEAVQVEVIQRHAAERVFLDKREGGAFDRTLKSRRPQTPPDEGGLAGTKISVQKNQASSVFE